MAKYTPVMEKNVECKLSDGTVLRADVYRPIKEGRYPVLLLRLPYDKETPRYYDEYLDVARMVQADYVVILQDVRGRFASDGDFYPFMYEGRDGYESVEWAAKLPYSNGKVGLFGMSYHGYTQLAAAAESPPSLKAIAPVMTMAEPWEDMVHGNNGASNVGNLQTWTLASILPDQLKRNGSDKLKKAYAYMEELPKWMNQGPANEWKPMKELDPDSFYFDFINEKVKPEFLEKISLTAKLKQTTIPALFMGGWFDALLKPTIQTYQMYAGPSMLWIGPWTHEEMTGQAGEKFFENGAADIGTDQITDPTDLHIKWFDKWLKDKPYHMEDPVQLYLTGQKCWKGFKEWPAASVNKELFLTSRGSAKSNSGDGRISSEKDEQLTKSKLKLDPANPVPTHGGGVLMAGVSSGMFEQSKIHNRDDVLVFTSAPLKESLDILGTVQAKIWASSKTPLLDLFIQLSDVEPDGAAFNVADTFYRQEVMEPEQGIAQCIQLDVNHTAYRFKKGHRLRVVIAASNAPYFDVNLNNGRTTKTAIQGEVSHQTIYHGADCGSVIILPVTPNGAEQII